MQNSNYLIWDKNFPPVYSHTSVSYLKHCRGFFEAKSGNRSAAAEVVNQCTKIQRIDELKNKYPKAVLLPIITKNKLPEAFAKKIGLRTYKGVKMIKTQERKEMSGMERLLHKPTFRGYVPNNCDYIIVDDIITQGGTISALRQYVLRHGGYVCAVTVLAQSVAGRTLAPQRKNIDLLNKKFSLAFIASVLRFYFEIEDVEELTNSQIVYLLRFKELGRLIQKVETFPKTKGISS